ncbi:MAG: hypothetical protein Q9211_000091 [Gyalolechia sp. 1 TL-2023]
MFRTCYVASPVGGVKDVELRLHAAARERVDNPGQATRTGCYMRPSSRTRPAFILGQNPVVEPGPRPPPLPPGTGKHHRKSGSDRIMSWWVHWDMSGVEKLGPERLLEAAGVLGREREHQLVSGRVDVHDRAHDRVTLRAHPQPAVQLRLVLNTS